MTLYTNNKANIEVDPKTLAFKKPTGNPLVLMMAWLMAKQKHLKKYAQIYTEMGFDVMVVHITPWQLLWPAKGTQVEAIKTNCYLFVISVCVLLITFYYCSRWLPQRL